jgi:hypothetical protein
LCGEELVARALLNLIRNSTRYAQRTISLSACLGPVGALALIVDDEGSGIPVAERTRIFESFHRLDGSRGRLAGRFGLGRAKLVGYRQMEALYGYLRERWGACMGLGVGLGVLGSGLVVGVVGSGLAVGVNAGLVLSAVVVCESRIFSLSLLATVRGGTSFLI